MAARSALALLVVLLAPAFAQAAPGDLDPSFGSRGKVRTDFGGGDVANAVAIDHQGRIVAAGRTDGDAQFALARYRPRGGLDQSFGAGGRVTTDFGSYWPSSMAIDSEGRIVVAGYHFGGPPKFALARYEPDGELDGSFSGDGLVRTPIGEAAGSRAVVIDSEDRIVVAGWSYDPDFPPFERFALARYMPDGSRDRSFGSGGKVTTNFGGKEGSALSAAIDSQGRIVAAGYTHPSEFEVSSFALARYTPEGGLDPSFGDGGTVRTHLAWSSRASSVAIDPQGRIVVAGSAHRRRHRHPFNFGLARYLPGGALDGSFGNGGITRTPVGDANGATSMALDSRGRIVAIGDGYSSFDVARFGPSGHLDRTFADRGRLAMGFGKSSFAESLTIDSRDRIVAAGTTKGQLGDATGDFALARYFGDGPTVAIFGPRKVRTRHRRARATFSFTADVTATFQCRVGSPPFRPCSSPHTTRRLRVGRHRLKVRATDEDGSRATQSKRFEIVRERS